ncbi:MAG: hypothetical protein KF905_12095 [Flavobacteriales bacterium]|nr:hypothetical protein [Flavobacteriales bacterium]
MKKVGKVERNVVGKSRLHRLLFSTHDPLPVRLIYVLVIIGGLTSVLDTNLPTHRRATVIVQVSEFGSFEGRHYGVGSGHMRYWSNIYLLNGSRIWTQRTANNFAVGDSIDVDLSAITSKVVRYRSYRTSSTKWYPTESVKEQYRPFPFTALLFAILLLFPRWSPETRMLLRGILFVVVIAWLVTLIATGG